MAIMLQSGQAEAFRYIGYTTCWGRLGKTFLSVDTVLKCNLEQHFSTRKRCVCCLTARQKSSKSPACYHCTTASAPQSAAAKSLDTTRFDRIQKSRNWSQRNVGFRTHVGREHMEDDLQLRRSNHWVVRPPLLQRRAYEKICSRQQRLQDCYIRYSGCLITVPITP